MGRIGKGVKCSVIGCDESAVRSLSTDEVAASGLKVEEQRHVYLCKSHYKEHKRAVKKNRMLEKWRYRSQSM
jgi:hypothetical protein